MTNPIVHFEIIGQRPDDLRRFYGELFGWVADTDSVVAPEISDAGEYGFIDHPADAGPGGIPGGIGGGAGRAAHTIFYVGVPDVAVALARAESLGGTVVLPISAKPGGGLVVAHFADPEGNVIGLAGPR
ncbi:putative enzyme related to lactoylglutathione lyase [Conyzicola lurida]|uniref:Putative enzyme related to lactoylglutathione lyase n=1 Tax=Conyzicola lurida TaxID=1172621 RepID=A0A841AR07_9MICO|nr:VOC family protein [Conyzicola lurida]MBB5844005.1 putative enzyme related to lactoylglutathione lyase [Conyzicola lurida]